MKLGFLESLHKSLKTCQDSSSCDDLVGNNDLLTENNLKICSKFLNI